ncbi:MAG: transposase [Desulfosoma sp.]
MVKWMSLSGSLGEPFLSTAMADFHDEGTAAMLNKYALRAPRWIFAVLCGNRKNDNDAVDQVRRHEQKERPELKGSRFVWLKNESDLTPKQRELRETLSMKRLHLKTARAYPIKLAFRQFYEQPPEHAEVYLQRWFFWATHSHLEAIIKAAYRRRKERIHG